MMRFRFWTFIFGMVFCALMFLNGCGGGGEETSATTSKSWHHPASLADSISPAGQNASSPQAAMDKDGNIIIVWAQFDGTSYQIFKSEYRDGVWHHPSGLSDHISVDGSYAVNPRVAMNDHKEVIIVWEQHDGITNRIFKSEYRNGIWTHPIDLSDNISPDTWFNGGCKVAMDDNGNAIIVWSAENNKIFMSEYRTGKWIHFSDRINPGGLLAGIPDVAMDNNGNAIIVWEEYDADTHSQIFKSEYRNGAWIHPANLTDYISLSGGDFASFPQVAMDNIGNAIIVYAQENLNHSDSGLFKSEFRGGHWHHPSDFLDKIGPVRCANSHSVAMDDNGNAIIVWNASDGINSQVFKSEYRNGAWKYPTDLTDNISPDGSDASFPDVAMDNNGNAVITWNQDNGVVGKLFKSEYRNGAWINPLTLSGNMNPDGQENYSVNVAMNNYSNAIIVWIQGDGTNLHILKSEYR